MPLAPLPNPENIKLRLRGLLVAMPAVAFLGSSLMAANAVQMASLPVLPISRSAFRKTNRWVANTWWGWCVTAGEVIHDISLVVSGDDVPMRENAIVIVNHQDMADITFVMAFAKSKDRLGDLKWFVKKAIKIVPGVGWGMVFLDCIFVDRQWTSDRASVQAAFRRFSRDSIPIWLVSFVEGTRLTPEKLVQSQRYARQLGIEPLDHVLLPRTKGFVASVQGLRDHVDAVYDLTLGYEHGVPSLWQYIQGFSPRAHLHVRRFPMADLPHDPEALAAWLHARFREKDELLSRYYQSGSFQETGS
ncbi:MAG TPA: lysophospholipid acyltransferase family protein [Polyangiaceae bacterium]|jgi:1-acyl-sn-glycerol-3-phosphate acyltransferase|nr:MAG: putative acyltransferase YihG [Deltaproteobacteria bacterium ADurb.Bin207]HNS98493.1 lysophospholipid acyltransferase family protein [Polyangiaceae bacterium]HNZ21882.1 lysophospholipid acyltransferase family protein [Polyangiaceae bacterium]HOD24705.1 lysophospholipid acyltransferase family protein [Polyangiaceae bacterium]HOE51950.1 lysophospholipid acyltransferase family protein [Polyangiaceae bacterium]